MIALSFRRADGADRSLAWVFALAAASALVVVPFVNLLARFAPACVFHALTGFPCPACGTTRAALALARGDLPGALAWNPLAALALVLGPLAGLLAPAWVALRGPLPVIAHPLDARVRFALIAALVLNWAYLLAKGV